MGIKSTHELITEIETKLSKSLGTDVACFIAGDKETEGLRICAELQFRGAFYRRGKIISRAEIISGCYVGAVSTFIQEVEASFTDAIPAAKKR